MDLDLALPVVQDFFDPSLQQMDLDLALEQIDLDFSLTQEQSSFLLSRIGEQESEMVVDYGLLHQHSEVSQFCIVHVH